MRFASNQVSLVGLPSVCYSRSATRFKTFCFQLVISLGRFSSVHPTRSTVSCNIQCSSTVATTLATTLAVIDSQGERLETATFCYKLFVMVIDSKKREGRMTEVLDGRHSRKQLESSIPSHPRPIRVAFSGCCSCIESKATRI